SGCVSGKNLADLRERRHLLNIRPQVVEHGMLVKNAEATPDRCLVISWRKSESETRAEALERRVRVELVHRAQCRESRIELLRLLRQVHAAVKRALHRRNQPIFLCWDRHELVANSQIESQGRTNTPVVLKIRTEHHLRHMPVGILRSGQLHLEQLWLRLQELRKIAELVPAVAPAAATDLLVPITFEVAAHPEGMRTPRNGETIHKTPKLLLIIRRASAITNIVERADLDLTQQGPPRTKCKTPEISTRQRNILHGVGKAVADFDLVQKSRRKNAGLVHRDD